MTAQREVRLAPEPRTADEWRKMRPEIRAEWMRLLGPMPERCPLNAEIVTSETLPDHTRYLVRYDTEPGIRTDAYLLVPPHSKPCPAAIVLHGTSSNHILQPPGLADKPTRHAALALVRRGFVTLNPRCYIFGTPRPEDGNTVTTPPLGMKDYGREARAVLQRRPGWTGMGKMLWDGMRAVDYLETRPETNPKRIFCIGHSLGAKESLFLAAFDERICAGAASEGGVGIALSNWDAPWYLGPQAKSPDFGHDLHEVMALIAPRPFMVLAGGSADGNHSVPYMEAARAAYRAMDAGDRLVLHMHDAGHDFPLTSHKVVMDWFEKIAAAR